MVMEKLVVDLDQGYLLTGTTWQIYQNILWNTRFVMGASDMQNESPQLWKSPYCKYTLKKVINPTNVL